jgi:hypothetical protein
MGRPRLTLNVESLAILRIHLLAVDHSILDEQRRVVKTELTSDVISDGGGVLEAFGSESSTTYRVLLGDFGPVGHGARGESDW